MKTTTITVKRNGKRNLGGIKSNKRDGHLVAEKRLTRLVAQFAQLVALKTQEVPELSFQTKVLICPCLDPLKISTLK